MAGNLKEVNYARYCRVCKHRKVKETEDPCIECLAEGARIDTHKPRNFVKGGISDARSKSKQ